MADPRPARVEDGVADRRPDDRGRRFAQPDRDLGALDELGGQDYLVTQARENPVAFLSLVGKILPKEIKADVAATHVIRNLTPEQQRGIAEAVLNR